MGIWSLRPIVPARVSLSEIQRSGTTARGFLIKSRDGTVDGCTIDGSSMFAILIDTELGDWMESMYAENITITDIIR